MTSAFASHVGRKPSLFVTPGSGDYTPHREFGYNNRKMTFGSRKEFVPDKNPIPG